MNQKDSPRTAVAWMLFASFSFGSMNALVKWTSSEVDVWTTVFIRSLVITTAIYIIAKIGRVDLVVHDRKNMAFRLLDWLQ